MSYKMNKETDTHYVLSHKNGDFLKIAKKNLSPELHATIKKMSGGGKADEEPDAPETEPTNVLGQGRTMQHYDDGTPPQGAQNELDPNSFVQDAINQTSQEQMPPDQPDASQQVNAAPPGPQPSNILSQTSGGTPTQPPQAPQQQAMAQAQATPNIPGTPNYGGDSGQIRADLAKANASNVVANKQTASLYGDYGDALEAINKGFQDNHAYIQGEQQKMADTVKAQNFNFNKVWQNKSVGKKITAGLGMLFGSIGSALTHNPNYALQILNDEIERDAKSQMANNEKNKTLFSMYQQMGMNKEAALNATKSVLQSAVLAQAQKISATNASPQQKLDNDAKVFPFIQNMQMNGYNAAWMHTQYEMMNSEGMDPETKIRMLGMSPGPGLAPTITPQQQEKMFGELKDLQERKAASEDVMNTFDQISGLTGAGTFSPKQREELLMPSIRKYIATTKEGRLSPDNVEMMTKGFLPKVGITNWNIFQHGRVPELRQKMMNQLQIGMQSPLLKAFRVGVPKLTPKLQGHL
jgi:hypothetical protein